jgi:hypothetical protein
MPMKSQTVPTPQVAKPEAAKAKPQPTSQTVSQPALSQLGDVHSLLQLQRLIGNRAVGRLIQAKLTVGEANDAYEQEADRVAQQVMSMAAPLSPAVQHRAEEEGSEDIQAKPLAETISPLVQRQESSEDEKQIQAQCANEEQVQRSGAGGGQAATDLESRLVTSQDGGSPSNKTGLPDNLKSGVEELSGYSLDAVRVHYNSSKPLQLNALAYTQGIDIHVAPGQEQHLPHEAWHVVQQAQGRVVPTTQMKSGIAVNDDKGLEQEADTMGAKALVAAIHPDGKQEELVRLQGDTAVKQQMNLQQKKLYLTPTALGIIQLMKEVCPGLFYDEETETFCDSEGNTYDDIKDFQSRGKSTGKMEVIDTPVKHTTSYSQEVKKEPAYQDKPDLKWFVPTSLGRDVRARSESGNYYTVYRFADASNPRSMYPYPGEKDVQIAMNKMKQDYDSMLDHSGKFKSEKARELFSQKAQLTVAYGRDSSPFIPVGLDYHILANHTNKMMQEIVREPKYFEMDPIRNELPEKGKRAPHILRFHIPVEKNFLLFKTYEVDDQAKSAQELEYFGPLEPFLTGKAENPY